MIHREFDLQKAVCLYLNMAYPKIAFISDTVASVKLTKPQAYRNKQIQKQGFKCPDLIIFQPNKYFHGMFLELKTENPFTLKGEIKASQDNHLAGQRDTLKQLSKLGYFAQFVWTFDDAKILIDQYMKDVYKNETNKEII